MGDEREMISEFTFKMANLKEQGIMGKEFFESEVLIEQRRIIHA